MVWFTKNLNKSYLDLYYYNNNLFRKKIERNEKHDSKLKNKFYNSRNLYLKKINFIQKFISVLFILIYILNYINEDFFIKHDKSIDYFWENLFKNENMENKINNISDLADDIYNKLNKIYNIKNIYLGNCNNYNSSYYFSYYNNTLDKHKIKLRKFKSYIIKLKKVSLKKKIYFPFNLDELSELKKFNDNIIYFNIQVDNLVFETQSFVVKNKIKIKYNKNNNYFNINFELKKNYISFENYKLNLKYNCIILILVALFSLFMSFETIFIYKINKKFKINTKILKSINNNFNILKIQKYNKKGIKYKNIFWWNKLLIFRNITTIVYTIIYLFTWFMENLDYFSLKKIYSVSLLFIISTLLSGIQILVEYKNYGVSFKIIRLILNNIFKIILVFLPIFLSFIFIGNILFLNSVFFNSIKNTFETLFSFIIGDNILNILGTLDEYYLIGKIYIILYVIVFVFAFQSILTTTISQYFSDSFEEIIKENNNNKNSQLKIQIKKKRLENEKLNETKNILEEHKIMNKKQIKVYKELKKYLWKVKIFKLYKSENDDKNKLLIVYYLEFLLNLIDNKWNSIEKLKVNFN